MHETFSQRSVGVMSQAETMCPLSDWTHTHTHTHTHTLSHTLSHTHTHTHSHTQRMRRMKMVLTPLQEALHMFLSEKSDRAELLINSHQQIQQRLQAHGALGVTRCDRIRLVHMSGPWGPGARGHGRDPAHPQTCSMIPEAQSFSPSVCVSVFLQQAEPPAPALFWCVSQPLSLCSVCVCVLFCVSRVFIALLSNSRHSQLL